MNTTDTAIKKKTVIVSVNLEVDVPLNTDDQDILTEVSRGIFYGEYYSDTVLNINVLGKMEINDCTCNYCKLQERKAN